MQASSLQEIHRRYPHPVGAWKGEASRVCRPFQQRTHQHQVHNWDKRRKTTRKLHGRDITDYYKRWHIIPVISKALKQRTLDWLSLSSTWSREGCSCYISVSPSKATFFAQHHAQGKWSKNMPATASKSLSWSIHQWSKDQCQQSSKATLCKFVQRFSEIALQMRWYPPQNSKISQSVLCMSIEAVSGTPCVDRPWMHKSAGDFQCQEGLENEAGQRERVWLVRQDCRRASAQPRMLFTNSHARSADSFTLAKQAENWLSVLQDIPVMPGTGPQTHPEESIFKISILVLQSLLVTPHLQRCP